MNLYDYHYYIRPITSGLEHPSQPVFGLDSKRSMVIVEVITVGLEPTVMESQHRRIGQWSDCKRENHRRLAPRPDYVQCGFTVALRSDISVSMWTTLSFGCLNHMCTGHNHRCIAQRPACVKCRFTVALASGTSVSRWTPPSLGRMNHLFKGHGHHHLVVRST